VDAYQHCAAGNPGTIPLAERPEVVFKRGSHWGDVELAAARLTAPPSPAGAFFRAQGNSARAAALVDWNRRKDWNHLGAFRDHPGETPPHCTPGGGASLCSPPAARWRGGRLAAPARTRLNEALTAKCECPTRRVCCRQAVQIDPTWDALQPQRQNAPSAPPSPAGAFLLVSDRPFRGSH